MSVEETAGLYPDVNQGSDKMGQNGFVEARKQNSCVILQDKCQQTAVEGPSPTPHLLWKVPKQSHALLHYI